MIIDYKQLQGEMRKSVFTQITELESRLHEHDGWSKVSIQHALEQNINHALVAYDYVCGDKDLLTSYCLYQHLFEVAEILRIGTHPDYQRQGLAQKLIETLIAELASQKVDRILLEVAKDNHGAIKLYHKLGFKVINIRKAYYQRHQVESVDAMIMQHTL